MFKEGDQVYIRWSGGNSGEYVLHEDTKFGRFYVYDSMGNVNYGAGEVFHDTESVELVEESLDV